MPDEAKHSAQVLHFERRASAPHPTPPVATHDREAPVENLAKYEAGSGGDDYRHRMMINVLVFVVSALLICGGIWLAIKIADLRKTQDCVLSGRRNCAAISVPQPDRY
jgi:hypothetical protein